MGHIFFSGVEEAEMKRVGGLFVQKREVFMAHL